ncbi:GBS Bsp-like repeat-containing protein [Streptococcaceae bacterium ESL0729]|nr:GBS Bsp-like repeat-containing protein [Streptococcaceae bacterium ESL0729]
MKKVLQISYLVSLQLLFLFMGISISHASAVNDYIRANNIRPASESVNIQINMQDPNINGGLNMDFADGKPTLVIIHEVANEYSTIDSEIAFMVRNQENAFVHSFADANSLKTIADTSKKAWGAGPFGNRYGVQIEQTREHSKVDFAKQVANVASWTADQLIKYNLGAPKLVSESSKALDGNLASHRNISYKWGGTDHVDPDWYWENRGRTYFGESYDMSQFRELVDYYYQQRAYPPKIMGTSIEGNPSTGKFSVRVKTNDVPGLEVKVPIWSNANGQKDLYWYPARKVGSGEFVADFDGSRHDYYVGDYTAHAYAYAAGKVDASLVNNTINVSFGATPKITSASIEGNPLDGKFSVRVKTNNIDDLTVKVPIWSNANGQDDLYWYDARKVGSGEYVADFNPANHNYESGTYSIHAYAYANRQTTAVAVSSNLNVSYATPSVNYSSHVRDIGWQGYVSNGSLSGTSGRSLQMEAIKLILAGNGGITYSSHVADVGWTSWSSDNQISGTVGRSLQMEAIKIKLTGNVASTYDVYYRVHIKDYGWLGWAKNGEAAGSTGLSERMEAIQVKLVKKGDKFDTGQPALVEPIPNVNYSSHIQDIGWQGYVSNGSLSGTTARSLRLEAVKLNLSNLSKDGGISYSTHIQDIGWQNPVANDALSGTTARLLRLEAIKINLTGSIANDYDVYYRVHIQDGGWLGWAKNGEPAGSSAMSKRLEGLNVVLVKKGGQAPGSTANAFLQPTPVVSQPTDKPNNGSSTGNVGSSTPSNEDTSSSTSPSTSGSSSDASTSGSSTSSEAPAFTLPNLSASQKSWFDQIYPQAAKIAKEKNLYASIMMSQAIAESSWGQSELAKNANNLFGIKADSSWIGEVYERDTTEYVDGKPVTVKAKFRKYSNLSGSLEDYAKKIVGSPDRYKNVLKSNAPTFEDAARALQEGGYATDPNYANNLINRIKSYKLDLLD